jgi:hypothetical protein
VTQAYNQGLQTGQALRNILLDPSKHQARQQLSASPESVL